jgi:hypothetical protein
LPKNNSKGEIRLLSPRRVPLSAAQYDEAVTLLAELLLDVAAKRRGVRSGGVIDSASDGGLGSVIPLPQKRRKGREAA